MGKNRLVVGIVFLCVFFELVIPAHTTHHVVIHQLTSAPGGQGGGECWPENAKSSYRQNQDPRKNCGILQYTVRTVYCNHQAETINYSL
jgi:hypothetical protein